MQGSGSRLLHGGKRWFLSEGIVEEPNPCDGPATDLFAYREDGGRVRLTDDPTLSFRFIATYFRWAPDENESTATVSFLARRCDGAGGFVPGSGGLYTVRVHFDAAGDVIELADPVATFLVSLGTVPDYGRGEEIPAAWVYDWSPDMTRVVADIRIGEQHTGNAIRVVDVGTGESVTIAEDTGCGNGPTGLPTLSSPAWSPGGELIAFNSSDCNYLQIEVMNPDGGARVSLLKHRSNHGKRPLATRWSPDGAHLAYTLDEYKSSPCCYYQQDV